MDARWFANGCVATPHHLASAAGQTVLANGGNAVDAAVAANLVLAVVTPYHCGVGGDLLAIVWDGDARGLASIGAAPSGATPEAIRRALEEGHGDASRTMAGTSGMPTFGALAVTVPGAVAGWFDLLARWGTRSFGDLAAAAIGYAEQGFPVSAHGAVHPERARPTLAAQPGWADTFGQMRAGERFVQTDLATTLRRLSEDGPDALYDGPIGARIVEVLQTHGSTMTPDDLARHRVEAPEPMRGPYRDVEVLELPPPTQGLTALTALGILDALGDRLPDDPGRAAHLQIEAVRAAMADREDHLAEPATMRVDPVALVESGRLAAMAAAVDPDVAAPWPPGRPAPGGTAYLCAADREGLLVSLIQSNFVGFGAGVVVPGTGIGLHDRGAHFSLDPEDPNAIAPGKRPLHTLIPGFALRDGQPWMAFGTMGGDGQPQIHTQLLGAMVDHGDDPQAAIDRPRWIVDVADGTVGLEADAEPAIAAGLRRRGHVIRELPARSHGAGHAHAVQVMSAGYRGGSDPRCEGAIVGL